MSKLPLNPDARHLLRSKLEERRISQSQLAAMAGIHRSTVSRILSGQVESVQFRTLAQISSALSLKPSALVPQAELPMEDVGTEMVWTAEFDRYSRFVLQRLANALGISPNKALAFAFRAWMTDHPDTIEQLEATASDYIHQVKLAEEG